MGFNVGVELGQIGVLLVALVLATVLRRLFEARRLPEGTYRRFVVLPATLAIAATGLFWTVERLLAV